MKQFCLAVSLMLATAAGVQAAAGTYYNNGLVTTPPVIDATNFVNEGRFDISTGAPFQFSSVLNFTNRSLMRNGFVDGVFVVGGLFSSFSSGFWYDTAPVDEFAPPRRPAANFFNAPLVGNVASNATIYGDYQLVVQATNIVNRGAMKVSEFGLISLAGKNVVLSNGVMQTAGFGLRSPTIPQGIFDNYWFFGTNRLNPSQQFTLNFPFTTPYNVIYFPPPYFTNQFSLSLSTLGTNSLTAQEFINESGSNRTVQIVFVRNANPSLVPRITFGSAINPATELGSVIVEWSAPWTNHLGVVQTNFLYLTDSWGANPTNRYITNYPYTPQPPVLSPAVPPRSFQPLNYSIDRVSPFLFFGGFPGVPFTDKPDPFWGIGGSSLVVTSALYSAYGVSVSSTPTTAQDAATVRGGPGRIEIQADRNLTAPLAQVDALSYIKLHATNHFSTATNSYIAAPFADVALASTNGYLNLSSVLQPNVHRISGTVDAYSVLWTNNVFFNGATNPVIFNVLMVDSFLTDLTPVQIFDASLKATNVEVGDVLNTLNSLSINASRLNVNSNGSINIGNTGISWETSVPYLRSLTNSGLIQGVNVFTFANHNTNGTAKPMDGIVNSGLITGAGVTMLANNLFSSGSLGSLYGPLALHIGTNITLAPGGILSAPEADVNIFCKNLFVTNHAILAGRSLNLNVTNQLLAGTNNWEVYDGFNLPVKPTNSELGNVVILDRGVVPGQPVSHVWSGSDRGPQGSGFLNNAALGMLILDGATNANFTFSGVGVGSNALYVDRLELTNAAGAFDSSGNLSSVSISSGMTIYYSQATINGASAAEFLDGKNGGRLRWISSRAGSFSGTNVVYPDGSTNFLNAALVSSCNLDSDNDGIVNCIDPSPISLLARAQLNAKIISNPNPMLSRSWLTTGWATNRVYVRTNVKSVTWQLQTNIVSPPQGGPPFTLEYIVPLGSSRFYRVDVVTPPQ